MLYIKEKSKLKLGKRFKTNDWANTKLMQKSDINSFQNSIKILFDIQIHDFILLISIVLNKYTIIIDIPMSLNKIPT